MCVQDVKDVMRAVQLSATNYVEGRLHRGIAQDRKQAPSSASFLKLWRCQEHAPPWCIVLQVASRTRRTAHPDTARCVRRSIGFCEGGSSKRMASAVAQQCLYVTRMTDLLPTAASHLLHPAVFLLFARPLFGESMLSGWALSAHEKSVQLMRAYKTRPQRGYILIATFPRSY